MIFLFSAYSVFYLKQLVIFVKQSNKRKMEELELLSAKLKIKELKKLVDELLIAEEVSDLERGHLKGIKSILNR